MRTPRLKLMIVIDYTTKDSYNAKVRQMPATAFTKSGNGFTVSGKHPFFQYRNPFFAFNKSTAATPATFVSSFTRYALRCFVSAPFCNTRVLHTIQYL